MNTIKYNTDKYQFLEIVSKWLNTNQLSKLHDIKKYDRFVRENDQSTDWHKLFYEIYDQTKHLMIHIKSFYLT